MRVNLTGAKEGHYGFEPFRGCSGWAGLSEPGFALSRDRRRIQPPIGKIFPSGGTGLLASFAPVDQDLFPNGAQEIQQLAGWAQKSARNGQPPMLHQADEFFETHLALMKRGALGAGVRMPDEEQDRANQPGPEFALHPVGVLRFGFIQTQDRLGLTEN